MEAVAELAVDLAGLVPVESAEGQAVVQSARARLATFSAVTDTAYLPSDETFSQR